MQKFLKSSREGFTLVELMIVVGIIGILATIAVPQYAKFTAKSRQTEVKIALGAMSTAESSFAVENSSFSGCIASIGYSREGTKFYYTVGFASVPGDKCSPSGDKSCLRYQWQFDTTTNAYQDLPATAACTDVVDNTFFLSNTGEGGVNSVRGDLPVASTLTNTTFVLSGAGVVLKGAQKDTWTVDEKRQMLNTITGLK